MKKGHICRRGRRWYPLVSICGKLTWLKGSDTKEGAQATLLRTLLQLNEGEYKRESKITFKDFKESFLSHIRSQVEQSTFDLYQRQVRYLSWFDPYPLAKISPFLIERFIEWKKVRPKTLNSLLTLLRQILCYSIELGCIKENPFRRVKRSRIPRKEIDCLSMEKINHLLDQIRDQRDGLMVKFGASMGLRIGEVLGSKWSDIDFESSRIHVQRSIYHRKKMIQSPKTPSSNRWVKIPCWILDEMRIWKALCNSDEWIFPDSEGNLMSYENWRVRRWKSYLRKAGLPETTTFHSLRHSNISSRLMSGQNLEFVSRAVGHSNSGTIINTYSHILSPDNFALSQNELYENHLKQLLFARA